MSESVSRYSIVERLTKTKLDIMGAKSKLDEEIHVSKQKVDSLKSDIKHDKKVVDDNASREKSDLDKALRTSENSLKNISSRKGAKEKLFDDKIKAIDVALKDIGEISKSAAQ